MNISPTNPAAGVSAAYPRTNNVAANSAANGVNADKNNQTLRRPEERAEAAPAPEDTYEPSAEAEAGRAQAAEAGARANPADSGGNRAAAERDAADTADRRSGNDTYSANARAEERGQEEAVGRAINLLG